jgi:hypothetical protein
VAVSICFPISATSTSFRANEHYLGLELGDFLASISAENGKGAQGRAQLNATKGEAHDLLHFGGTGNTICALTGTHFSLLYDLSSTSQLIFKLDR